jgi:hypothetical protein
VGYTDAIKTKIARSTALASADYIISTRICAEISRSSSSPPRTHHKYRYVSEKFPARCHTLPGYLYILEFRTLKSTDISFCLYHLQSTFKKILISGTMTTYNGNCHCGAVRYTLEVPRPLESLPSQVVRCNCSICSKNGYLMGAFVFCLTAMSLEYFL